MLSLYVESKKRKTQMNKQQKQKETTVRGVYTCGLYSDLYHCDYPADTNGKREGGGAREHEGIKR